MILFIRQWIGLVEVIENWLTKKAGINKPDPTQEIKKKENGNGNAKSVLAV